MFALVLTGCALALLVWRPWQTRANVTAAQVDGRNAPTTLVSELTEFSPDDPRLQSTLDEVRRAPERLQASAPATEPPAKPEIIGSWRDDFYGKRIFHFRDDGTATMTIELDAIGQAIYGPKLTFSIDWKLENDVLTLKMTGGKPKSALAAAKLFGETSEQRVESLDASEMKLRSLDSNKLYTHRRVNVAE